MDGRPHTDYAIGPAMGKTIQTAARQLARAQCAVALTGAGASTESGIPDFRSAHGIWAKYPPEEYATIDAFHRDPDKVWSMWRELGAQLQEVRPNPGHVALAEFEKMGKLEAVITQNIDNLHQAAGNTRVIEYHGNARRLFCLTCHRRAPFPAELPGTGAPRCACGGIQKPDVVFFGEIIPQFAALESEALAQRCDLMLIIGTSAQVYPAAALPHTAKRRGAVIIECNLEPTDFTASITDHFLQGPCGQTLPKLLEMLRTLG